MCAQARAPDTPMDADSLVDTPAGPPDPETRATCTSSRSPRAEAGSVPPLAVAIVIVGTLGTAAVAGLSADPGRGHHHLGHLSGQRHPAGALVQELRTDHGWRRLGRGPDQHPGVQCRPPPAHLEHRLSQPDRRLAVLVHRRPRPSPAGRSTSPHRRPPASTSTRAPASSTPTPPNYPATPPASSASTPPSRRRPPGPNCSVGSPRSPASVTHPPRSARGPTPR